MPTVGFEPTISAGERPQTYALDRVATGTAFSFITDHKFVHLPYHFTYATFPTHRAHHYFKSTSYVIYLANSNCTLLRIFKTKIYILVSPLPLTFQALCDVIVKHPLRHRGVFKTLGMHLPPCAPLLSNGGQDSELQYRLGYLLYECFIAHLHAS